jgi:hypothetical protein
LLTPKRRELLVDSLDGSRHYRSAAAVQYGLQKLADAKVVCYVTANVERMKDTTGAQDWTLDTWGNRPASITHHLSGLKIMSLRGTLDDSRDPFSDLVMVLDWLNEFGVAPGGLSAMSWNLWRSSLVKEVSIGADPELGAASFFGGRQSIDRPGVYYDQKSLDMKAAYATLMAARPIAAGLMEVDKSTYLDPTCAGLARATVIVPTTLPYPPLPTRLGPEAIQFQSGALNGIWPWDELAFADEHGCDVIVRQCWAPTRELDIFTNWWLLGQEGRELPGAAARLVKSILNCLWGQYAMEARTRTQVTWTNASGTQWVTRELGSHPLPHRYLRHVAAEITSRVRVELHRALYDASAKGHRATHIDTDGFLIHSRSPVPRNYGNDYGQFRCKERITELDVRAPQLYRFKRRREPDWDKERNADPGRPWHYVAAGMTLTEASEHFRRGRHRTTIDFLGQPDATLPDSQSFHWRENEEWANEARLLR